MSRHLERELEELKRQALALSALVEQSLSFAFKALEEGDVTRAKEVVKSDMVIDDMEIAVEENCLKILALHQPVAADLRKIISILKMNNELERIGDLAVNIAERAHCLGDRARSIDKFKIPAMSDKVMKMLKLSVDSMVSMDIDLAYKVCAMDDSVDDMNKKSFDYIEEFFKTREGDVKTMLQLLSVSRYLERIADHATNIAEEVVYMISGEIVRHHIEDHTERNTDES